MPQYIVIHETDNESVGANAVANRNYFANHSEAQSSTHFVVDDHSIIQCAELNWKCWHVGDNQGYSNIINSNTVGIEICVNKDGNYEQARSNAIDLTKYLMSTLNLGADRVVKHQNASGKHCPRRMIDNSQLWNDFKNRVSNGQSTVITSVSTTTSILPSIKTIQQNLNKLGIRDNHRNKLVEDGITGINTTGAITNFQSIMGLSTDGIYGSQTDIAISQILSKPLCNLNNQYKYANRYIQFKVGTSIDGEYGNSTLNSVKLWQSKVGLQADGIVGQNSWKLLIG